MTSATSSASQESLVSNLAGEYTRYRTLGERALAQIPEAALNYIAAPDGNSAAMIVFHMSGNLRSRFTDFLTTDGEKPLRNRDEEFENRECTRDEVNALWSAGWNAVEGAVSTLTDADLTRVVTIRQVPLTVHAALCRSIAHAAYHVGQLVLLARTTADQQWRWLSIPKGESNAYNANPRYEKGLPQ
jgi:Protein of unknown function (DUF1572)